MRHPRRTGAMLLAAGSVIVTSLSASSPIRSSPLVSRWTVAGAFRGTPAADQATIFARTDTGGLVAVDAGSGQVRWRTALERNPGIISGGRLLLTGSLLVAGDDRIEAFDVRSGRRQWVADTEVGTGAGIQLGTAWDGLVFTGSYVSRLFAIDAASGRVRWSVRLDAASTVFSPRADDDGVVVSVGSGGSDGGGVAAFNRSGQMLWRTALDDGAMGPVLLTARTVVVADRRGVVHGVARATGQMMWTLPPVRMPGPAEDFRPLASSRGMLVVGSLSGEVVAYDLATREERWRAWPSDASVAFGLAAGEGVVWVPYVSGRVVALDLETGREKWRFGDGGEGFRWVPFARGADIVLAGIGGGLVAYRHGGID